MHDPHLEIASGQQEMSTTPDKDAASWCFVHSTVGGVHKGTSAPGVAEADRRQGALAGEAGTEGGPQPQQGEHSCHAPSCEQTKRRIRRRPYQRGRRLHGRTARFNDEELALITAGANAAGITVAAFLAHAALAAARDLDRTAAEIASRREIVVELFAARRHLSHIGNNLNQVAKALNSGAEAPHANTVVEAVRRAVARVDAAAQHLIER
ncbi:plasmid mobilization protein [Streptomyces sp. NPDC020379]|uniref:plasmid mobilization protein n=1 Tax=Streptomyces sp. NPDC020379 TaxID=3365071 RepID=UPI0037AC4E6E